MLFLAARMKCAENGYLCESTHARAHDSPTYRASSSVSKTLGTPKTSVNYLSWVIVPLAAHLAGVRTTSCCSMAWPQPRNFYE